MNNKETLKSYNSRLEKNNISLQDVLDEVNALSDAPIEKLYLIRNGIEQTDVTGGHKFIEITSDTNNSNYAEVQKDGWIELCGKQWGAYGWITNNSFDFTKYVKIYVEYDFPNAPPDTQYLEFSQSHIAIMTSEDLAGAIYDSGSILPARVLTIPRRIVRCDVNVNQTSNRWCISVSNITSRTDYKNYPLRIYNVWFETDGGILEEPELQNKTITPSETQQVVTPDLEFDGLSNVIVEPIPDEYKIMNLQDKSIEITENGTQTIVADEGYNGLNSININVDVSTGGGADLSEYFTPTLGGGNGITTIYTWQDCFKKFPPIPLASNSLKNVYMGCLCPEIDFTEIKKKQITNMSGAFKGAYNLTYLDFSEVDLSKLTQLDNTFNGCSQLKEIDFGDCDFSSVTYGPSTFSGCTTLEKITWSNVNMPKNRSLSQMFNGCKALSDLNVKNLCGATNTTLQYTFQNCSSLESLDLSGWNTSGVTTMEYMFGSCGMLKTLDLSNFNTSNVTTIAYMFQKNTALESLDLSNFDLTKITTMAYLCQNDSNLISVNISGSDSIALKNINYMFDGCTKLTTLDLSGLNGNSVTAGTYVFRNCSSMQTLILGNQSMFKVTNANAFTSSGIASGICTIYVPDDLIDTYKANTYWAPYANQIKGMSELPTE